MKIIPYTILISVVLLSCQNSKKKAIIDLQDLLTAIKGEMELYQATATSINVTHRAMLSNLSRGQDGTMRPEIADMIIPHKRLSVDYEEALKNYLNLIPQLENIIYSANEKHIVALSLENSYNQLLSQKNSTKAQLDELKAQHEAYRKQFEAIEK